MSIEYTLKDEGHFVHTEGQGVLTDEELRAYVESVNSDPRIQREGRELLDLRAVSQINVSAECIEQLAHFRKSPDQSPEEWKTAIVVSQDLMFGLSRMFQLSAEVADFPAQIGVFKDLCEAREWLGIDDTELGLPSQAPGASGPDDCVDERE